MTQEKELQLKDLCARLPYGVIVRYKSMESEGDVKLGYNNISYVSNIGKGWWVEAKPYLRPMSSMTEEEENKYNLLNGYEKGIFPHTEEAFDWLNSYHFDYRGLIPMGLALEAPDGIYNEKKEPTQIPATIDAAVYMLDTIVSDEDKEYILKHGSISVHHSLGRWIRNEWDLWGESDLKKVMLDKGVEHPDDMSDYIIQCFINHLKKKHRQ